MNPNFHHLRPKLDDILNDTAPYPYTLSAFITYLSQIHSLEILEFVLEVRRYRQHFHHLLASSEYLHQKHILRQQWHRILQSHIVPGASQEINIPENIRHEILVSVPGENDDPPDPAFLDPATQQMQDLLHDSILLPFLRSCVCQESVRPLSMSCLDDTTINPKKSCDGTRSEQQRRQTRAEIFPYSPDTSSVESESQPQRQAPSQSQSKSISFDRSRPSSVTFCDDRPTIPRSFGHSKQGSMSSAATRSMHTMSDIPDQDLTRTKSTPIEHRQGWKRWHRLQLQFKGGIFRHFRRSSES